jgi:hypothetical protein
MSPVSTFSEYLCFCAQTVCSPVSNEFTSSVIDACLVEMLSKWKIQEGVKLCQHLGVMCVEDLTYVKEVDLNRFGWLTTVSKRKFLRLIEEIVFDYQGKGMNKPEAFPDSSEESTPVCTTNDFATGHASTEPSRESIQIQSKLSGCIITVKQSVKMKPDGVSYVEEMNIARESLDSPFQVLIFDSSRFRSRCMYNSRHPRLINFLKETMSIKMTTDQSPIRGDLNDSILQICICDNQSLAEHLMTCLCCKRSVLTANEGAISCCTPSVCVWKGSFVKMVDSQLCILRLQSERASVPNKLAVYAHDSNSPIYINYLNQYSSLTRPSLAVFPCFSCEKKFPRSKLRKCRGGAELDRQFTCEECNQARPSKSMHRLVGSAQVDAIPMAESFACSGSQAMPNNEMESSKSVPTISEVRGWTKVVPVNEVEVKYVEAVSGLRKRVSDHKQITVFLSSPFQGLLHERDGLVSSKGPILANMCESKGVTFNFVDLRWGISNTMSKRNLTIKTCLQCIAESDVFVGFFGQRYGASMLDGKSSGWIKPSLELCYDKFGWLKGLKPVSGEDEFTTLKSVTHLEFEYGYNDKHYSNGNDDVDLEGPLIAYAFFRDKEYDSEQISKAEHVEAEAWKYRPENTSSADMLDNLKEDVLSWAKGGRGAYYTYKQPADFCKVSYQELKGLLEQVLPQTKNTLETLHDSFVKAMARNCVRLESSLSEQNLMRYVNGGSNKILAVTGAPGSGKSSLLARFVTDFESKHPFCCLYHFCGLNRASRQLDVLLERMIREAVRKLSLPNEIVRRGLDLPLDKQMSWNRSMGYYYKAGQRKV